MSWFTSLSKVSRRRKLGLFYRTFQPNEYTRILDVGAEINPTGERGLQLIDTYRWKHNLTALNLSKDHICQIKRHYPQIEAVVGDACHLPWPDKYFDVVYSNAVIEHVGDYERQKQMAREIMRVGKRWFVCTPNRWYPFEFHLRLPLVTWLAGDAYLHAARVLRYDHVRRRYTFVNPMADFRLMSFREMKSCFSNSRIIKQRVTFMAETLIALGPVMGEAYRGENERTYMAQNKSQGDYPCADSRLRAMSFGFSHVCGTLAGSGTAGPETPACEPV